MTEILREDHPVDGRLMLTADTDRDLITLTCRWPFDLSTDEWIDITNEYSIAGYRSAVDGALSQGRGSVDGVTAGYLRIARTSAGFTLEFSNTGTGFLLRTFSLSIDRPLDTLTVHA